MPKHECYLNEKGQVEFLDLETGEVFRKEISINELADYVKVGNRWVPFDQVERPPMYNAMKGLEFAEKILDGIPIRDACKQMGIDYRIYVQWKTRYAEFRELMANARKDRAEIYFEKIEEAVLEAGPDQEEVALARVRVDAYKHLAGVSDPRYSARTTIEGQIGVGIISIETGIRRQGDLGYKEEDVSRGIEEGQKKIELQESTLVPMQVRGTVEGTPVSEADLDGKKAT